MLWLLFCLQQRAGLGRWPGYCVEPAGLARLASYFHLLAQMKVAKAKGLNIHLARCLGCKPRTTAVQFAAPAFAEASLPRPASIGVEPILFVGSSHLLGQIGIWALLFGYFLLGPQEKVTAGRARPAGCRSSDQP